MCMNSERFGVLLKCGVGKVNLRQDLNDHDGQKDT